ncbi:MAG: tetratricopeptide (TPR) repeat protein [Candidatus Azotimanducaceae bacterium]|jgi:tetratricopeptide (TPR) repeat protein
MLKANLKSVFFITLVSTLTLLAGCNIREGKKNTQIEEARARSEAGAHAEALKILEDLTAQYPNDLEILKSIGQIYSTKGDATMAAFFLEQAYLQSPENNELLFLTYQSLEAANQPAGYLLEKLTTQAPKAMTPELWIRLGQIRQADNKVQPALDAYLRGVDPDKIKPSPETAATIGQLYVKVGNLPQAETWLEIAADNDDPNALTALFSLLEINLRQKDWQGAEASMSQLDKQFPGAVAASQWQQARQELTRWRQAQDEMKAKLATAEVTETNVDTDHSATAATEGKAQVIADLEAAEAMANAPAIEIEVAEDNDIVIVEDSSAVTGGKSINFDPNIAIEPADPEITLEVSYDQAPIAEETSYSVDNTITVQPAPAAFEAFPVEATEAPIRPSQSPRTIEEWMADAETETFDREYKSAIRKYWAAISIANNRADIWNLLSRAYLVDGQLNNAETAALEAVRLEPREVAYTLDYLRVAQRSKELAGFLAELETAYDRFPSSPEITLSLARAHERISKQTQTARNLYLRFIDIAPNHPLISEARAAVARL